MGAQQHKPGAPVVGFNHNLNYKGRTFHVQTEDSGPQHAHIITHIFLGGNIFASTKSSYADVLPGLAPGDVFATVRKLMEDQHKAMMKALASGQHDAEIERRTGGTAFYEPGVLAGGARAPGLLVGGDKKPGESTPPPAKAAAPVVKPAAPAPAPVAPRPVASVHPPPKAAPRPAARPEPAFGDGLVSERSLDEVILAYLAADLDGPKR